MNASGRRPWWRWPGYVLNRATMMELRGFQSLWRLAARRPRVPGDASGFTYHEPILGLLIVLIVVSTVEVVAVDVILARWPAVRAPVLILGIWGVVYLLGLLAGVLTRPHAVGPAGILVRYGPEVEIVLPWQVITSVELRKRTRNDKEPQVTVADDGTRTYHIRISDMTNVEILLDEPVEIRLPHGTETVDALGLYADDPRSFLKTVRELVGTSVG